MERQDIITELKAAFDKYGIPEVQQNRYLKKFDKTVNSLPEEERKKAIEKLGSPDKIARELKEMIDEKNQEQTAVKPRRGPGTKGVKGAVKIEDENEEEEEQIILTEYGEKLFKKKFWLSCPLWGLGILIIALLFITCYALLFIVDIVLSVAVTLFLIVGIILGLFALLYGIIGLLPGTVSSYIGLYELGLGLMILGIMLVVGIVVYQFIIKITPFVLKKLKQLIKFTVRKIKSHKLRIRMECDKR